MVTDVVTNEHMYSAVLNMATLHYRGIVNPKGKYNRDHTANDVVTLSTAVPINKTVCKLSAQRYSNPGNNVQMPELESWHKKHGQ